MITQKRDVTETWNETGRILAKFYDNYDVKSLETTLFNFLKDTPFGDKLISIIVDTETSKVSIIMNDAIIEKDIVDCNAISIMLLVIEALNDFYTNVVITPEILYEVVSDNKWFNAFMRELSCYGMAGPQTSDVIKQIIEELNLMPSIIQSVNRKLGWYKYDEYIYEISQNPKTCQTLLELVIQVMAEKKYIFDGNITDVIAILEGLNPGDIVVCEKCSKYVHKKDLANHSNVCMSCVCNDDIDFYELDQIKLLEYLGKESEKDCFLCEDCGTLFYHNQGAAHICYGCHSA